jgi:hypothetical protein
MNPLMIATLRRHWPLIGGVLVFFGFLIVHVLVFQPGTRRLSAALKRSADLGLPVDPAQAEPMMPPRLFALLAANSLPAAVSLERTNSGALVAELVGDVTALATQVGMEAVTTEPGTATPHGQGVIVRARLRLRAEYTELVALTDALARSGKLYSVDRFSLIHQPAGAPILELYVSRYVLKQPGVPR